MYLLITVCLIVLFLFGVFLDYLTTLRERNLKDKNRKTVKLQNALAKSQRLLNGRTVLPLSVMSSIVCLERSLIAVRGLINLASTESRIEALKDINKKLNNFKALEPTLPYFYALQEVPTIAEEQARMLKQSMLLVIILKVEHAKGRLSVEELKQEVSQLDILIARLKSTLYSGQAMQYLELKDYLKAQALTDKAIDLLASVLCENSEVKQLIEDDMAKLALLNDGVGGVIDEKSHTFYDKFKGQDQESEPPKKESKFFTEDDDGLDGIFGKKRKY